MTCLSGIYFSLILNQQNQGFVQYDNVPISTFAIPAPYQTNARTTLFWSMSCKPESLDVLKKNFFSDKKDGQS